MSDVKRSLTAAIHRYKGDWNTYLADCLEASERGEPDNLPVTYESSLHVLETWNRPAVDIVEAMLALEFAVDEFEVDDTTFAPAMVKAALGWVRAEHKRRASE